MVQKAKNLLTRLSQNKVVRKAFHTFWQSFVVVFGGGVLDVLHAFRGQGLAAGKAALLALLLASAAAGLSALKTLVWEWVQSRGK